MWPKGRSQWAGGLGDWLDWLDWKDCLRSSSSAGLLPSHRRTSRLQVPNRDEDGRGHWTGERPWQRRWRARAALGTNHTTVRLDWLAGRDSGGPAVSAARHTCEERDPPPRPLNGPAKEELRTVDGSPTPPPPSRPLSIHSQRVLAGFVWFAGRAFFGGEGRGGSGRSRRRRRRR